MYRKTLRTIQTLAMCCLAAAACGIPDSGAPIDAPGKAEMADFEHTSRSIGTYACKVGTLGQWQLASGQSLNSDSNYQGTIFPDDEKIGRHLVINADHMFYPEVWVTYDAGYENSNHYENPELFTTLWTENTIEPKVTRLLYPDSGSQMESLTTKGTEGVDNEFHLFVRPLGDFSGMVNYKLAVKCKIR